MTAFQILSEWWQKSFSQFWHFQDASSHMQSEKFPFIRVFSLQHAEICFELFWRNVHVVKIAHWKTLLFVFWNAEKCSTVQVDTKRPHTRIPSAKFSISMAVWLIYQNSTFTIRVISPVLIWLSCLYLRVKKRKTKSHKHFLIRRISFKKSISRWFRKLETYSSGNFFAIR